MNDDLIKKMMADDSDFQEEMDRRIDKMRSMVAEMKRPSGSEILARLREKFPEASLEERVKAYAGSQR